MQPWVVNALLSMFFAGITGVLAKYGMRNVHPDLALAVRTAVVLLGVLVLNVASSRLKELGHLGMREIALLTASGLATMGSWIFYYRAMKDGPVSYVAAIDKGSIVVTLVLAFILLREPITPKVLLAAALITSGLVLLVWK